jgi:hypothetical protein
MNFFKRMTLWALSIAALACVSCEQPGGTPKKDPPELENFWVQIPPNKTLYIQGEPLETEGLVVSELYSDDSAKQVTGYALSDAEGNPVEEGDTAITAEPGEKEINISWKEFTASFSITVLSTEDAGLLLQEPELYFDYGRRRVASDSAEIGRYTVVHAKPLVLAPIRWGFSDTAAYEWYVDGVLQSGQSKECFTLTVDTAQKASYTVTVKVEAHENGKFAEAETLVHRIYGAEPAAKHPKTDASRANAWNLVDFSQSVGQFVGGYPQINADSATEEQVLAAAQAKVNTFSDSELGWAFSLGAWGGYAAFGFDHSVVNRPGNDIQIGGNPLVNWSEPGTVWVMQDEDGDGLPNNTWYELKGSAHGNPQEATQRYALTYFRGNETRGPIWVDNRGNTGMFSINSYYGHQGFPSYVGDYVTFVGTLLRSGIGSTGGLVGNTGFAWGYVDNEFGGDKFDISNAVQADGTPANLKYIDFVKVQTAVNALAGVLGEISTETGVPHDLSMMY